MSNLNFSHLFFILFLVGICFDFILNQILELVDFKFRQKHGKEIPEELKEYIDEATLEKTVAYENEKYFFWIPKNCINFILTLSLVLSGFYPFVFNWIVSFTNNPYLTVLLFVVLAGLPQTVLAIPFDLYREFKIEKKYGFSTMTFKLWIADQIKALLMNLILLVPLLMLVMVIVIHLNNWWWLLVSSVIVLFSLGISYIYPTLLAPIFNKFSALEEGELKTRLENLLGKTGFKSNGIFTMDASKRSKHSNAYFTGLGKNKRIVLYDTLVAQLTPEEIEAVLGHELGHYKHHHITKKLCISIPMIFIVALVVSYLVKWESLYTSFGLSFESVNINDNGMFAALQFVGMFFLSMTFDGFENLTSLVGNYFSRKDEFQADKFSAEICGTEKPLCTSLIKLNKENLSEINVPEIYSVFNYNHPPLMERINAMKKINLDKSKE